MSTELRGFQVTIPAGTAQSSPLRVSVKFPTRKVDTLEIVVPPGPSGLMGFAITMGGVNVIPIQPNTFLVTDNERIRWPLDGLPDSGDWQVTGYNTDVFDHSIYLRWLLSMPAAQSGQSPIQNIDLSLLSSL